MWVERPGRQCRPGVGRIGLSLIVFAGVSSASTTGSVSSATFKSSSKPDSPAANLAMMLPIQPSDTAVANSPFTTSAVRS